MFKVDSFAGTQYKTARRAGLAAHFLGVEYLPRPRTKVAQTTVELSASKPTGPTEIHPQQTQHREAFETFLQTKYVGQKRFSLESASVIP